MSQTPIDRDSLQVLLAKVHERLNEAGSVDTASREQLSQVMADLERKLGEDGPTASADDSPRLELLAVRFEAEHPDVAATLRRLIDLLGKAGI